MSRLVDLCRQSIVFENMEGIARCLQEIRLDPDAVVIATVFQKKTQATPPGEIDNARRRFAA